MKRNTAEIIAEAIELPPEGRALVAEALLESLDFEQDFPLSDEWHDEIRRRCAEIDSGNATLLDGDDVLMKLREEFS